MTVYFIAKSTWIWRQFQCVVYYNAFYLICIKEYKAKNTSQILQKSMQSFIQIKLTRYLFDLTITQQTPKNRLKTYALSRLKQQYILSVLVQYQRRTLLNLAYVQAILKCYQFQRTFDEKFKLKTRLIVSWTTS